MINNRLVLAMLVPQVAIVSSIAAEKPTTDAYVTDAVMQKLAADQYVKGGAIDVTVKDGAVTLAGNVHEQKQKDKAEKLAKKVHGVKSVVNNIKIEKP